MRFHLAITLLALSGALVAGSAAGFEGWTVELTNGAHFETRYAPEIDPADGNRIHLLTDQGNRITLPRRLIRTIRARPVFGGRPLDGETVELGTARQLAVAEGETEAEDPTATFRRRLLAALETTPYSVEQFVEPEATGGIPLPYHRAPMPEAGSPWRFVTPQDRP